MSTKRKPSELPSGIAADIIDEAGLVALWEQAESDSVFHIKEVQGVDTLEDFQENIVRAVDAHERVAIKSCHDMGKTWTMAKIILAIGSSNPDCKIVTTAPTGRQVKLLLWAEIRAGHLKSKYPLGGVMGIQEWKFAPDWWAIGFTTQKQAGGGEGQANSSFQGVHAPLVVVVFDEATGIAPDIWKQVEGLLTSHHVKFVAIGNPTSKASEFYKCFFDASYKKLHLSCFDSPNLKANGITCLEDLKDEVARLKEMDEETRLEALASYKVPRPKLLTTRWVMSMALKWGVDHALFVSKVLGEFPDEDESCLMPLGLVETAQRRVAPRRKAKDRFFIGVDVARKGGDKSVITRLGEISLRAVKVLTKRATTEVSGAVIAMVNDLPEEERLAGGVITVDATGIGSGVLDEILEYQRTNREWRNIIVQEFHCGNTWKEGRDGTKAQVTKRAKKYVNKKAEAFVLLAESVKADLCLLKDDTILGELPTIQYYFDSKGRWQIEDKDAYKKRTGRGSPDHSDSLSLANYGRFYSGSVSGTFTKEMAGKQGRPIAGGLNDDE